MILFMHWGVEFANIMAVGVVGIIRKILKSTEVDLIVGAHPHVTQKHWNHKKTLIAPSLGNLLFTPYVLANFVSRIMTLHSYSAHSYSSIGKDREQ